MLLHFPNILLYLREAEGKRGVLLLELEKEKAKWDIEKDNLNTKCQELNDKVNSLEKKNETLLRENEKLKNEKNVLRSRGYTKNPEFKFGSHLSGTTIGSKKYDYRSHIVLPPSRIECRHPLDRKRQT